MSLTPPAKVAQPRPRITPRNTIPQQRDQTSPRGTSRNALQKKNGKNHTTTTTIDKNNQKNIQTSTIVQVGRRMKGQPALPGGGGQPGNQNYHNGRIVKQAFMNELSRVFKAKMGRADTLHGLEAIAGKVIKLAMKSSLPAAREVFDRVDGRPAQTIMGDPDNPVFFKNVSEMSDEELESVARGYVINGTAERVD